MERRSSKNIYAKVMVEINPMIPIIEKLFAANFFIAKDTKKEGIIVNITAIKTPNTYTW